MEKQERCSRPFAMWARADLCEECAALPLPDRKTEMPWEPTFGRLTVNFHRPGEATFMNAFVQTLIFAADHEGGWK